MKKYIAIQQENYDFDFELLIDDDGIRSAGGKNCEVFGISFDCRNNCFLNEEEYKEICDTMDSIVTEFDNLTYLKEHGWTRPEIANGNAYNSYKEIIGDYLYNERYRKFSPKMVKELKTFVENYGNDSIDDFTEFLSITTGMNWVCKRYNGYCQGDVAYLVYCSDIHDEDYMNLIGNASVGCVTEFCISENPIEIENRDIDDIMNDAESDCYYGVYLTDSDVWNEDKCKEKLAEYIGCSADELAVIVIDGSYTVTKHNYKVA